MSKWKALIILKETVYCDDKKYKCTHYLSHKSYLSYLDRLDEMVNRGQLYYTLKRRNNIVTIKAYL